MANWNRQGGSNRDNISKDSRKSPKTKTQANDAIEKLKQSKSTSFKLVLAKDKLADYGEFGNEVNWITDDLTDLDIDEDLTIPTNYNLTNPTRPITDNTRSDSDDYRINASSNITPYNLTNQYEIVVKYATNNLVLTIMSGQAYMARNDINNAKFDYALVVVSTVDLKFGTGTPSKANAIIMGGNSSFKIIDSLYQWVRGKLTITSDATGKSSDANLSAIPVKTVPELPDTGFTYQDIEHLLFGSGDGLRPVQICLSAIDKLLTFRSLTSYPSTTYDVLWIGERLALCAKLGGDEDPNPNPVIDYRFIAVFIDGSFYNIGGYDVADSIESILPSVNPQNNLIGFNAIDPNAIDWKGIKPRSSPNPPAYTGMYWRLSYVKKIALSNNLFEYKLALLGNNFVEQLSPPIDKFATNDPYTGVDLLDLNWIGANRWQSRLVYSDKDEQSPVSPNNPQDTIFDESDRVFPNNRDGRAAFVLSMRPVLVFPTNAPISTYSLYRVGLDGVNLSKKEFIHQELAAAFRNDYHERISATSSNSSYQITAKLESSNSFNSNGNTTTNIVSESYLADYYNRLTTVVGQVDLTVVKKTGFMEYRQDVFTESQTFRPENSDYITTSRAESFLISYAIGCNLNIGDARLNSCPLPLSLIINNSDLSASQIDSLSLNICLKYKYFSKVSQDIIRTQDGSEDISGQVDYYYIRESKYYTAKTALYEYLETAYFTIITSTEIINCKVSSLSAIPTNNNVTIVDPTRYTSHFGIDDINTENDGAVNVCYTSPPSCYYFQTSSYWLGFDPEDIVSDPQSAIRQLNNINYAVMSRYPHSVSNVVPSGKSKILFVDTNYFNPSNTIIAKPASSDSGLIARIYKSYRSATKKATVEKWAVHNSGWIELVNIEETPLGEYSPTTRNIYYYPG